MAEEEVDWDDDWRGAGQAQLAGTAENDIENGNGHGDDNGKHEDDVISLDGAEVETEVDIPATRNKIPPTGPRDRTKQPSTIEEGTKDNTTEQTTSTSTENGGSSPLPPGWTAIMSKSHNRHFFYHKETNTTVWEKPSIPENKDQQEVQPKSPPLVSTEPEQTQTTTITTSQAPAAAPETSSSNNVTAAYATRKQPPSGPARRDPPREQQGVRGIETKPHYDKYWNQRDHSTSQPQDRRRPRDTSPPPPAARPGYDRDYKRFKGDDERRYGSGPGDFRRQGPPSDSRDSRSAQAPSGPADDPRTRPYNGAIVPPVIRYPTRPRSPPPPSRGSSTPYNPPPPASRYSRDSRPPPRDRDDGYSRAPPRHEPAPYPSRGSRPPPIDEAEIERAKIREEARKAQEKLEFLKQAEARLEREMSEKRHDPFSRGPGPRRDGPPSYDSRSDRGPPSSYDQDRDRRPYTSRPPEPSGYDREPSYASREYDDRPPPPRGGYESRPTRGGYGYESRPPAPPRGNSPPFGRARSPPPTRYADSRRSPPPPSFASRLGPRPGNGDRERDLARRLGPGGRRGNELAAEPMSDRRPSPPPPPFRGNSARPLAERMSR
ncbi:hypothetical protein I302_100376 [Kwoniella bestiolae CBS 10118]|uniref:WW domain-containing protein n=1 Tax=Kwoniella bestiolae CBS 10118 TaxID=1296100 RepID=A0A1B9G4Y7_9TREE|nr:hypothetical protein I302_03750 [Kwoniella bestiolae CBS 10118]OCF26073.1 hypothetical protein I302_03750 [Kwoniella bestiolae CBS 10118]